MLASVAGSSTLVGVPTATARPPWPVLVAIGVLALQSAALLGFSGWLLLRRLEEQPSNEQVFEGSAVYLLLSGFLVALVAIALRSLRGWAYGATVVVQLLALGVTYEMVRGGFWLGAVPMAVAAGAALAALFSRSARAAFNRDQGPAGPPGG
jgi:hypothetical protein